MILPGDEVTTERAKPAADEAVTTVEPRPVRAAPAPAPEYGDVPAARQFDDGPTPPQLLTLFMQKGADLAQIERIAQEVREWRERQAYLSYLQAFTKFKSLAMSVRRNRTRGEGPLEGTKYADLNEYNASTAAILAGLGLSVKWRPIATGNPNWIEVACVVQHVDGYSEETSFGAEPDDSPDMNAIQARKSAVTYLERITFGAALGLTEESADDDGAATGRMLARDYGVQAPAHADSNEADLAEFIAHIQEGGTTDEVTDRYLAAEKAWRGDRAACDKLRATANARHDQLTIAAKQKARS